MKPTHSLVLHRVSSRDNYFTCIYDSPTRTFFGSIFYIKTCDITERKYISNDRWNSFLPIFASYFRKVDNVSEILKELKLLYSYPIAEAWICDDIADSKIVLITQQK